MIKHVLSPYEQELAETMTATEAATLRSYIAQWETQPGFERAVAVATALIEVFEARQTAE